MRSHLSTSKLRTAAWLNTEGRTARAMQVVMLLRRRIGNMCKNQQICSPLASWRLQWNEFRIRIVRSMQNHPGPSRPPRGRNISNGSIAPQRLDCSRAPPRGTFHLAFLHGAASTDLMFINRKGTPTCLILNHYLFEPYSANKESKISEKIFPKQTDDTGVAR